MTRIVEWRPVVGWEGRYEVSEYGEIRTVARTVSFGRAVRKIPQAEIYRHRNQRGYLQVVLWKGSLSKSRAVHRLVLDAFVGVRPDGLQCRHLDGNALNNHFTNLKWGSSRENIDDRTAHGRHCVKGSSNPRSRLSEVDVHMVRGSELCAGDLSRSLGVSLTTIRHIRSRKTWAHI